MIQEANLWIAPDISQTAQTAAYATHTQEIWGKAGWHIGLPVGISQTRTIYGGFLALVGTFPLLAGFRRLAHLLAYIYP